MRVKSECVDPKCSLDLCNKISCVIVERLIRFIHFLCVLNKDIKISLKIILRKKYLFVLFVLGDRAIKKKHPLPWISHFSHLANSGRKICVFGGLQLGLNHPSLNTYLSFNTFQYFLQSLTKLNDFCVIGCKN
jgi:hypothetical protein